MNALCPTGRIGTPKDISELALELNPSNSAANQDPAMAITSFGRYDEALIYLQKAIDLDPSGRSKYEGYLPLIYLGMKDAENAKRWITLFWDKNGHSRWDGWLAAVEAHRGNMEDAEKSLAVFLEKRTKIKTLRDYEKVVPTLAKDYAMKRGEVVYESRTVTIDKEHLRQFVGF